MATPEELNRALSERIHDIIPANFPNAKKAGASYKMGDLDGDSGQSTGIYRGRGGVFLAKDNATGETVNILSLLHRKWGGSWAETMAQAKSICGITDVRPVEAKPRPPKPRIHVLSMRDTPPYDYLKGRGIGEATMAKYKLRRITQEQLPQSSQPRWNGEYVLFPFEDTTGDMVMYKWLGLERDNSGKKEIGSTYPQYSTLWGWWLTSGDTRAIIITEGEVDAMSVGELYPNIPALSMPAGSNNLGWIDNDYERLQQFEAIYLLTDMDDAGEAGAQAIAKRLGQTRCFRISLPPGYNDANDYLQSRSEETPSFITLVDEAKTYDPAQLRGAMGYSSGLAEEIERFNREQESNPFMWPDIPFRFRYGELTVVTGYPGHGKSNLIYQSILHEIVANNRRVCVASFEIPAKNMLFQLMWMYYGTSPCEATYADQVKIFEDKLWFIENGDTEDHSWKTLRQDFVYANKRFGIDLFVIDALMHITVKGDAEGTDAVAKSSALFCVNNSLDIILVCHANAKNAGSGRVPEVEDILGGQGIGGAADNVIAIWRNKKKELELAEGKEPKHNEDARLHIQKQRANGVCVFKPLWFNKKNRTFMLDEEPVVKNNGHRPPAYETEDDIRNKADNPF